MSPTRALTGKPACGSGTWWRTCAPAGKTIVIITHLVFEQDRFDLVANLSGGQLIPGTPAERNTMPTADLAITPGAPAAARGAAFGQFGTAWRFALRNQARNRLAGLLLIAFVPAWVLLMAALTGPKPLSFRLFATGQTLAVDGRHLTLISAGLSSLTLITGFALPERINRKSHSCAVGPRYVAFPERRPTARPTAGPVIQARMILTAAA